MQDKLAEMKSKYMTQVSIRVKPAPDQAELEGTEELPLSESFNILNSSEMGLAKQVVINDRET